MMLLKHLALTVIASITILGSNNSNAQQSSSPAPPLLTREAWGAKPALGGMRAHKPYSIIVHHTGVKQTGGALPAKLRNLQSYAQKVAQISPGRTKPAWGDLPYHFYVNAAGVIAEGRDVRYAGDTNTKYDTAGHIQVVLEGNFEIEEPTEQQLDALRKVILWQAATWRVPISTVSVHRDHARTQCPGRNLLAALPRVLAGLK